MVYGFFEKIKRLIGEQVERDTRASYHVKEREEKKRRRKRKKKERKRKEKKSKAGAEWRSRECIDSLV